MPRGCLSVLLLIFRGSGTQTDVAGSAVPASPRLRGVGRFNPPLRRNGREEVPTPSVPLRHSNSSLAFPAVTDVFLGAPARITCHCRRAEKLIARGCATPSCVPGAGDTNVLSFFFRSVPLLTFTRLTKKRTEENL